MKKKCVIRASILATVLAGATVGSLALAGEFDSSAPYACNIQVNEFGGNIDINLTGSSITPSVCAQAVKQSQTAKGAIVAQVSSVPGNFTRLCAGDETGSDGKITISVYSDGSSFAKLIGGIYCGQLVQK